MNEDHKLREARFFLRCMVDGSDELPFHVSAFLSAARSVLQYALREMGGTAAARCRTCGEPLACPACGEPVTRPAASPERRFYDEFVAARQVTRFMKTLRDAEIHVEPAPTATDAIVTVLGREIRASTGAAGRVVIRRISDADGEIPFTQRPSSRFVRWDGPESVVQLCEKYLAEVEELVNQARRMGFLKA